MFVHRSPNSSLVSTSRAGKTACELHRPRVVNPKAAAESTVRRLKNDACSGRAEVDVSAFDV